MPELVPEDLPLVTVQTALQIQQNQAREEPAMCENCEHEHGRPVVSDAAWIGRRTAVIECGRHSGIRECCIAFFVNTWLPCIDLDLCHPDVVWRHEQMDRLSEVGVRFGFVPCDACLTQGRTLPPLQPCPSGCKMWGISLEREQARILKAKFLQLEQAVDVLLDGRLELDNFAVDLAERFIGSEFLPNMLEQDSVDRLAHRVIQLAKELQLHCASTIAEMRRQDEKGVDTHAAETNQSAQGSEVPAVPGI